MNEMTSRTGDGRVARWLPAAFLLLALPAVARSQSGSEPPRADSSDFVHHERTDGEGADRSLVATPSEDGLILLGWQCTGTGLRVLLALGWRLVGNEDDDIIVVYRFPADDRATETLWRLSATGTVAWMRIGDILEFSERALAADSVRMTLSDPFDGESREEVFGLAGIDAALELLGCEMRRPSSEPPA